MSRITATDVAEIFETSLEPSVLTAFVEDAHRIVEQRCGPYTDDQDALATVETYLAAHLATAKDPRISQGSHDGIQVAYEGSGERYWHKAILADPTNRLARPSGYATFST